MYCAPVYLRLGDSVGSLLVVVEEKNDMAAGKVAHSVKLSRVKHVHIGQFGVVRASGRLAHWRRPHGKLHVGKGSTWNDTQVLRKLRQFPN